MKWLGTRKGQSSVKAESKVLRRAIEVRKAERQGRVAMLKDLRLFSTNQGAGLFTREPGLGDTTGTASMSTLGITGGMETVKSPAAVATTPSKHILSAATTVKRANTLSPTRGGASPNTQTNRPVELARQQSWLETKQKLSATLGSDGFAKTELWSGHPPQEVTSEFKSTDRDVAKRARGMDIQAPQTAAQDTTSLNAARSGIFGLAPTAEEEVMEEEALLRDVFEVFTSEGVKGLDPSLVALLCLQGGVRLTTDEEVVTAFEMLDADGDGVVGLNDLLKFVWSAEDLSEAAKTAKRNRKRYLKAQGKTKEEKLHNHVSAMT